MEIKEIVNIADIALKYVIPLIAILISILSFHEANKVNKIQVRLSEMEEKLKGYELEEKEKEREAAKKSLVEARICKISRGSYKLKIWNSGQTNALNVDYLVPDEIGKLVWRDKVPFEVLEPGKSFEENIVFHSGIPSKFLMKTIWTGENGEKHEKEQIVTF